MSGAIQKEIEQIAESVFEQKIIEWEQSHKIVDLDSKAAELRSRLALIHSKERVSVGEAALLLSCSEGHIRNLVKKAKKGTSKHPIPFLDLDGPTVFDREKLLEWANMPKEKALRAVK